MKNIWFVPLGICALLALSANESLADYGEGFLAVRCDPKAGIFEVEPRLIWNEELDALQSALKRGGGRTQSGDYELFNISMLKPRVETTCKLSSTEFKVLVVDYEYNKLQVFENDNLVMSPVIDDVWRFWGYIFKVRHTSSGGWEEMCGREESANKWMALDRKRKDTNCREPLKKAPNKPLEPTR